MMEFEIDEIENYIRNKHIPTVDSQCLSYRGFMERFMSKNLPCVIKNIADNWEAMEKWVKGAKPNLEYLNSKYKHTKVIIYDCQEKYFNSQKCEESTFDKYISRLRESPGTLYYAKDWHLKLQCKDQFYEVPIYFASDWLNEYFTQCTDDDYRFVYVGQKGTWTPFHADVFNSYSWSVNVCGRKRWIFFPPGEEKYLEEELGSIPYDINKVSHSRKCFEVIQNAGDAVFVPSGWYHQVWNLEDTISINHNWINGFNIDMMWEKLKTSLKMTRKEIDDCKEMPDFEGHCQTVLRAFFGINYKEFYDFLKFIAESRLEMISNESIRTLFHGHQIGEKHILYDLCQVYKILKQFLNCDDVNKRDYSDGLSLLSIIEKRLISKNLYPL